MPIIPEFVESIREMERIHKLKNDDYANDTSPFFNFDIQEYVMSLFNNPRDKVFMALIGLKLGRLANLLNKKGEPNNESIEDSFTDLANYVILHKSDYQRRIKPRKITPPELVNKV